MTAFTTIGTGLFLQTIILCVCTMNSNIKPIGAPHFTLVE